MSKGTRPKVALAIALEDWRLVRAEIMKRVELQQSQYNLALGLSGALLAFMASIGNAAPNGTLMAVAPYVFLVSPVIFCLIGLSISDHDFMITSLASYSVTDLEPRLRTLAADPTLCGWEFTIAAARTARSRTLAGVIQCSARYCLVLAPACLSAAAYATLRFGLMPLSWLETVAAVSAVTMIILTGVVGPVRVERTLRSIRTIQHADVVALPMGRQSLKSNAEPEKQL